MTQDKKSQNSQDKKSQDKKSQSICFTLADKKSQLIFLLNMYVGRTKSHNIYIYTLIHVRYVDKTKSHNINIPRFIYGMQVGQKVTICMHLDSCTVCRQDRKSQYVYTQIHVRYVGRTESHNMYTLMHVCIILLCIVLNTDHDIVSGSFRCFKLYYSLSYQLAV